jgi:hypothetical protein
VVTLLATRCLGALDDAGEHACGDLRHKLFNRLGGDDGGDSGEDDGGRLHFGGFDF